MRATHIDVVVTRDVQEFFKDAQINGHGGFQSLCRGIAERMGRGRVLKLEPNEFRRIVRYASDYGEGGFQQRLRKIVTQWVNQNLDTLVKG